MSSQKVQFAGSQGDMLAARPELPASPIRGYAVFAHCFTCSKDIFAAARIAGELAAHGIAVLRFDFTGLGATEGEFANTDFSSNVEDLPRAADFLRQNYEVPQILIGHSLGGAAVLAVAGDVPEVRAAATIGAPADAGHGNSRSESSSWRTSGNSVSRIASHGSRPRSSCFMHRAIRPWAPRMQARSSEPPDIPKASSLRSPDDADHLLSRRADAIYIATILNAWVSRFVEAGAVPAGSEGDSTGAIVRETRLGHRDAAGGVAGSNRRPSSEPRYPGRSLSASGDSAVRDCRSCEMTPATMRGTCP